MMKEAKKPRLSSWSARGFCFQQVGQAARWFSGTYAGSAYFSVQLSVLL